jgi:CDP-diacylglycerol--glycerol-3-phosphate 3-phosphatidyltransferase
LRPPASESEERGDGEELFREIISGIANAARPVVNCGVRFTLPNVLTLSRVPAMFVIVWLMNSRFPWAATFAFWLFIAAALTDWLDGLLARRANQVSAFGRFMDAVIDKAMVIGLMIALVAGNYFIGYELVALLLLLVILGREFFISGMRMAAATKGLVIEADLGGKVKTFMQLNAIGWLMGARMMSKDFGDVFPAGDRWIISTIQYVGMGLYALSVVLTITSGLSYFRRHGHVVLK